MKQNGMTINYLRMEAADNGLLITYELRKPKGVSANVYSECSYESKKEVFEVANAHDAMDRFIELSGLKVPEEVAELKG